MSKTAHGCWNRKYYGQMVKMCRIWNFRKNADSMVILCKKCYVLLSGKVFSRDKQNNIELVGFAVVFNVHNIINHWNCSEPAKSLYTRISRFF